jgi:hypothetical protein
VTTEKATADKEDTDAAMAKKAADDVVTAAIKAATNKEVADVIVEKKATDDAALMKGCRRRPPGDW